MSVTPSEAKQVVVVGGGEDDGSEVDGVEESEVFESKGVEGMIKLMRELDSIRVMFLNVPVAVTPGPSPWMAWLLESFTALLQLSMFLFHCVSGTFYYTLHPLAPSNSSVAITSITLFLHNILLLWTLITWWDGRRGESLDALVVQVGRALDAVETLERAEEGGGGGSGGDGGDGGGEGEVGGEEGSIRGRVRGKITPMLWLVGVVVFSINFALYWVLVGWEAFASAHAHWGGGGAFPVGWVVVGVVVSWVVGSFMVNAAHMHSMVGELLLHAQCEMMASLGKVVQRTLAKGRLPESRILDAYKSLERSNRLWSDRFALGFVGRLVSFFVGFLASAVVFFSSRPLYNPYFGISAVLFSIGFSSLLSTLIAVNNAASSVAKAVATARVGASDAILAQLDPHASRLLHLHLLLSSHPLGVSLFGVRLDRARGTAILGILVSIAGFFIRDLLASN